MIVLGGLAFVYTIGDTINIFENIEWLQNRYEEFILLLLSNIIIHLISDHYGKIEEIQKSCKEVEENLVPGFGGKLEFYLIAKRKGLHSVTVNLNLEGYTLDDSGKKVERLENNKIQNLLKGHILFFRHFDDTYGYYDWLGEEPTITVDAPKREEGQTFVPNIPYKVTLYWKWPQYFRNYIYTQRSMYGDLFTDEMVNKYSEEYTKFIDFVNSQKTIGSSKLFYVKEDNEKNITEEIINNQMSDEILNTCNSYYNQADEYIGKNTQYVYVKIEIAEVKTDVAN